MRLSRYFLPVLKENPSEAQIVSHRLMLRAGMIKQQAAGIYSWLPLGFKVLRRIEQITDTELAHLDTGALCDVGGEAVVVRGLFRVGGADWEQGGVGGGGVVGKQALREHIGDIGARADRLGEHQVAVLACLGEVVRHVHLGVERAGEQERHDDGTPRRQRGGRLGEGGAIELEVRVRPLHAELAGRRFRERADALLGAGVPRAVGEGDQRSHDV